MPNSILQDVLLVFLVAIPVVILFHKIKLPSIIGFLATGALIGPFGIGLIPNSTQVESLAEIGVALLLFSVGIEFSFKNFAKLKRYGLLGGLLQIVLTIAAGTFLGWMFGWNWYRSFYLGCIISISSTAVVLASFYTLRTIDTLQGQIATAILILQDFAVVAMLIILPAIGVSGASSGFWLKFGFLLGESAILIAAVAFSIRYLVRPLFNIIADSRSRELFVIAVITLALGMAWFTHWLGLSLALGAFLGGIMVGSTKYQMQALSDILPFRFCFNSLFFTSVGMLINWSAVRADWSIVITLLMCIPLLKTSITTIVLFLLGLPLRLATVVGVSLGQIGEFSFLLAYLGFHSGVLQEDFYQWILASAALSMAITPVMMMASPNIAQFVSNLPLLRKIRLPEDQVELDESADKFNNHVIICGFGPIGQRLGDRLQEANIPFLILELNPSTVRKQREIGHHVYYGDGASEEILYHCGMERARLIAITMPDHVNARTIIERARAINPHVTIVTRAKYEDNIAMLKEAGADIVIAEELQSGIIMSNHVLGCLGIKNENKENLSY